MVDYFINYSILLMFAGFGAWVAFKRGDLVSLFALIIGLSAVYVSGAFVRLLVYASIGIIILAGIGLGEVIRSILQTRESAAITALAKSKFDPLNDNRNNRKIIKSCIGHNNYFCTISSNNISSKLKLDNFCRHTSADCC